MGVGEILARHKMEFVYPYQYNVHDTTYYYYEPPMVEVVDSMGMMSMSPVSSGSMSPTSAPSLYIPDQNNNHNTAVLTPEGEYEYPDQDYNKLNNYILNDAFIIVDPEYPFIDLPYIHNGKSFNGKKQKGFKKGGYKAYTSRNQLQKGRADEHCQDAPEPGHPRGLAIHCQEASPAGKEGGAHRQHHHQGGQGHQEAGGTERR